MKHTLVANDGKFIGEWTFTAADPRPAAEYVLPDAFKGVLWATSACNLHDLWVTEFEV